MLHKDEYDKGASDFAKGMRLRTALSRLLDANAWADDLKNVAWFKGFVDAANAKVNEDPVKDKDKDAPA